MKMKGWYEMNFPFFTCGGLFWWVDRYSYAGWRIQECIWTKRCRLLDPYRIRRATGKFNACYQSLMTFVNDWEIPQPPKKAVVFLHGLYQGSGAFEKMARRFADDYEIMTFSYPMRRFDITGTIMALNDFLNRRSDIEQLNFVATGIGGMILRCALAGNPEWAEKVGRSVFIAVGSRGYGQLKKYCKKKWFPWVFGKMNNLLIPEYALLRVPQMSKEFAVIIGGKEDGKGVCPWLDGDNDGLLRVADARDKTAKADFLAMGRINLLLLTDDQVIELTRSFIKNGQFGTGKRIRTEQLMTNLWDN